MKTAILVAIAVAAVSGSVQADYWGDRYDQSRRDEQQQNSYRDNYQRLNDEINRRSEEGNRRIQEDNASRAQQFQNRFNNDYRPRF